MMAIISETLYRKYRPQNFDEVLGQEEVISVLTNSIANKSISHSYLFSGGRGTGKTSIARIFAKELGTADEDIYEIDAASNRGIGEIRELKAGVDTRPFRSDYKVYIIDEVHMLTKEAFNALLKTLEEPPSHVLFILATTEKHKILDTIISRCQVFDFKNPNKSLLVDLVKSVCKKEKRKIDQASAEHIASLGDGSFRDTLSHLQKTFAYFSGDIVFDELASVLLVSSPELVIDILGGLSEGDQEKVFTVYHTVKDNGMDVNSFVRDIIEAVRSVLLLRYSRAYTEHLELEKPTDLLETYRALTGINSNHLKDLLSVEQQMSHSSFPEGVFEVYLFEHFAAKEAIA